MQLKAKSIRTRLTAATCSVLGVSIPHAASAQFAEGWNVDSAVLYYAEKDRVSTVEPVINARKDLNNDEYLNFRFVIDVLTGASPNGAVPAPLTQTFTGPSGTNRFSVGANELPLDPTFSDTRVAGSLMWEKPTSRMVKRFLGANFSTEQDYTSFGASNTYTFDIHNKLTTLSAGAALNLDFVSPVGGTPTALSEVSTVASAREGDGEGEDGEEGIGGKSKLVGDLLFGVTRVLSRRTITQFNVGLGLSNGYLSDPYKILSMVNPATGELAPGSGDNRYKYVYEKRPDSRARQSLFWKINHQFTNDVVYFSYRYYQDDWGVVSHTAELRYRLELGQRHYLQPHLRYYTQSAANFYHYFLPDQDLPKYASADYRLGEMTTKTVGLQYGVQLNAASDFSLRLESIIQSGNGHPDSAVGNLRNYNLFPGLDAFAVQASFKFRF